jgi:hypothetical protein
MRARASSWPGRVITVRTWQWALGILGGAAWTIAYLVIIYRGFRDRASGMPLIAVSLNISWEFVYSFVFPPVISAQRTINTTWFLLDAVVLFQRFRFGRDEFESGLPGLNRRLYYPATVLAVVFSCLAVWLVALEWRNGYAWIYSAYIMNALMSVAFVTMLARRQGIAGQSVQIAFWKMTGTLAPAILYGLMLGRPLVAALGVICLTYDLAYLVLIVRAYRGLGLSPLTRKQVPGPVLAARAAAGPG